MNRRNFLFRSGVFSGGLIVAQLPGFSLVARADDGKSPDTKKKFFVLIRAQNGWDVTLGLDPQIMPAGCDANDMFIEYRPEDILSSNSLRLAPAAAPMMPHASNIAVINGVFMSDSNVDHSRNLEYATNGTPNDGSTSLAVDIATHSAIGRFGVLFDSSLNSGNTGVMTTTFSSLQSLATGGDVSFIGGFLNSLAGNDALAHAQNAYIQGSPQMQALNKLIQARSGNGSSQSYSSNSSSSDYGFLAAAGFASGCANQAQLTISENLDTHSQHPVNHLKAQTSVWSQIADICKTFKSTPFGTDGSSVFDHTTFMVVSEFSRTPALDASQGKDHNPFTNSVMLIGNGIVGGQSIGSSHLIARKRTSNGVPRHVAMLYDYDTGAVAHSRAEAQQNSFEFIRPENVAATVRSVLSADGGSGNSQRVISRIIKSVS